MILLLRLKYIISRCYRMFKGETNKFIRSDLTKLNDEKYIFRTREICWNYSDKVQKVTQLGLPTLLQGLTRNASTRGSRINLTERLINIRMRMSMT